MEFALPPVPAVGTKIQPGPGVRSIGQPNLLEHRLPYMLTSEEIAATSTWEDGFWTVVQGCLSACVGSVCKACMRFSNVCYAPPFRCRCRGRIPGVDARVEFVLST